LLWCVYIKNVIGLYRQENHHSIAHKPGPVLASVPLKALAQFETKKSHSETIAVSF